MTNRNNTGTLSITEASAEWGISRNTIYKKINTGELSRRSDKTIDVTEMLRVFGEPSTKKNVPSTKSTVHESTLFERTRTLEKALIEQQLQHEKERREIAENKLKEAERSNEELTKAVLRLTETVHLLEAPKEEKKKRRFWFF